MSTELLRRRQAAEPDAGGGNRGGTATPRQRKREKRDVHGWIVLDKPVGMTSTHAVSVVKRLFTAKRAGHAGTLDPLASGCLPIALGEATKTVPFVMDGRKIYLFTVQWGEERDTDDAEGRVVAVKRGAPDGRRDARAAAALHRHHRAGAAALLGHQDRRRARLRPRPRRRGGRARAAAGRHPPARPRRGSRPRSCGFRRPNAARAPMCARSPATSAGARLFGHVSALRRSRGRAVRRSRHDFTGRASNLCVIEPRSAR